MYSVHQAKTNLSRLIAEAEQGKEVIIARGNKPAARLVAISKPKKHSLGLLKGKLHVPPESLMPLSGNELKDWGY